MRLTPLFAGAMLVPAALSIPIAWTATLVEAAASSPSTSFGDGHYQVGRDVAPGTYATTVPSDSAFCAWQRENSLNGSVDAIIALEGPDDPGMHEVVTIEKSDKGFKTTGCGTWKPADTVAPTTPATSFGDGIYRVGTDIAPGTYASTVPSDSAFCAWQRENSLNGSVDAIIALEGPDDPGMHEVVTIEKSDKGFKTTGCGTWKPT